MPAGKKIRKIYQAGGRVKTVEKAKLHDSNDSHPCLYIIDADLDLLTGKRKPRAKSLYRLEKYCFENFLFCSMGMGEFLTAFDTNCSPDQIREKIKLDDIETSIVKSFLGLFSIYAVCQLLGVSRAGEATVKYSVIRLCKDKGGILQPDRELIANRIRFFKNMCINDVGFSRYMDAYKIVTANRKRLKAPIDAISGKSYIFPILHRHCSKECRANIRMNQLAVGISRFANAKNADGLRKAIEDSFL